MPGGQCMARPPMRCTCRCANALPAFGAGVDDQRGSRPQARPSARALAAPRQRAALPNSASVAGPASARLARCRLGTAQDSVWRRGRVDVADGDDLVRPGRRVSAGISPAIILQNRQSLAMLGLTRVNAGCRTSTLSKWIRTPPSSKVPAISPRRRAAARRRSNSPTTVPLTASENVCRGSWPQRLTASCVWQQRAGGLKAALGRARTVRTSLDHLAQRVVAVAADEERSRSCSCRRRRASSGTSGHTRCSPARAAYGCRLRRRHRPIPAPAWPTHRRCGSSTAIR